MRFSNQAIREAKSPWTTSLASVERSNRVAGIATVAVLAALVAALSMLVTRRLVARPLTRISCLLEADCEQVHLASTQTASVSQAIADGASQQAASLEEASASLAEMSSMTRRSAESAETAKETAARIEDCINRSERGVVISGRVSTTPSTSSSHWLKDR